MKNRIAVSSYFFTYGFMYANWVSRLPELQRIFNVNNAGLGSLLFLSACGGLIAMPLASWVTTKIGTKHSSLLAVVLFCCFMPLIPLHLSLLTTYITFVIVGLMSSSINIAINGQAILIERNWGKPIMSSFHALFSIGMAMGALSGAIFSKYQIHPQIQYAIVAIVGTAICAYNYGNLLIDTPEPKHSESRRGFTFPAKTIVPLGIIAFCGTIGEGSMADWSAIYTNTVVGGSASAGALAFGTFGLAMTIGRLSGDYVTLKVGKYRLLLIDSILAAIGLTLAVVLPYLATTFLGFFIIGIGLSTVVPIIYSAAGNTKGVLPSTGIAMVTSIGNLGFFIGPPTIGYIGDLLGLRVGLAFPLLLFLVMLAFVFVLKQRRKAC